MRFQQKCIGARWSETSNKWNVQLKDLTTDTEYQDSADVLVTGEGVLNEWKWPEIDGIKSFKGHLLHSANWDPQIDLRVSAYNDDYRRHFTNQSILEQVCCCNWIRQQWSSNCTCDIT